MDILGIAESHLTGSNGISVDGYKWFGHNRRSIHVRAKCGSSGVGILVRNELCANFIIQTVDDTTDGIMWIKLENKQCTANVFFVCVVYLPAENSTRAVNIYDFFRNSYVSNLHYSGRKHVLPLW